MLPVVRKLASFTTRPIAVQPNAGLPVQKAGATIFPMSAEAMAQFGPKFHEAGANIIGGCCGTTPDYINRIARQLKGKPAAARSVASGLRITSRMKTVLIGPGHPFCLIGEKINPTGRKKFAGAIAEGRMDLVVAEARKQYEAGATALDINVGVPLTDEPALMGKAITAVQNVVDLPLVIDSSYIEALEQGLINYPRQGAGEQHQRRRRAHRGDLPDREALRRRGDRLVRRKRDPGEGFGARGQRREDPGGRREVWREPAEHHF